MLHKNEACEAAQRFLRNWLARRGEDYRILLVKDVTARLRLILWCPERGRDTAENDLRSGLEASAGEYWSGTILRGLAMTKLPDGPWQNEAWEEADETETEKLRILERHRAKAGWFDAPHQSPWTPNRRAPHIVAFYSFKGGVGRSTALAATALRLAASGEPVVVLDADLDAPGVGALIAGPDGQTAAWGIVDYLLERPIVQDVDLTDYFHRCPPAVHGGSGEVMVFPAGTHRKESLHDLARLDYGTLPDADSHPLVTLLEQIRKQLAPSWILVDSRSGLGEVSGLLTGGLCHTYALVGTLSDANWLGLSAILERLGRDRILQGLDQKECVLLGSLIPETRQDLYREAVARFTDRARDAFAETYYAEPELRQRYWSTEDLESADAPHVPVVLPYKESLAWGSPLADIAPVLLRERCFAELVERLEASRERQEPQR